MGDRRQQEAGKKPGRQGNDNAALSAPNMFYCKHPAVQAISWAIRHIHKRALYSEKFWSTEKLEESPGCLIMWSLWGHLYILVPLSLQSVLQQIATCQWSTASNTSLSCVQRFKPPALLCRQRCSFCWHLTVLSCSAGVWEHIIQNNQTQESVLGTNTARVSALEMLCFD